MIATNGRENATVFIKTVARAIVRSAEIKETGTAWYGYYAVVVFPTRRNCPLAWVRATFDLSRWFVTWGKGEDRGAAYSSLEEAAVGNGVASLLPRKRVSS